MCLTQPKIVRAQRTTERPGRGCKGHSFVIGKWRNGENLENTLPSN